MFSGIVQSMGQVERVAHDRGDMRLVVNPVSLDLADLVQGTSIACAGCCLTLVDKGDDWFATDVSAETLKCTNLDRLAEGAYLNLEPSLKIGDELGGHFVTGHIDGLAVIDSITPDGASHRLDVRAPARLVPMIAPKGSVCLDGISLTVNDVEDDIFSVNIIPHTWAVTTLRYCQAGSLLNIEADILARYALRARHYQSWTG